MKSEINFLTYQDTKQIMDIIKNYYSTVKNIKKVLEQRLSRVEADLAVIRRLQVKSRLKET
ncbi:MAG: hypothetical protein DKM50_13620 [Candidatus Margulisiibacteriota bacterium]|nr:MAG: hypothetical protein A2X43_05355 [Candidatus Margulisbacteria bacterium GWD2_39_127]OGI03430.1 MAG: hypothetical protein A2X42_05120 [Candidatus Margulisbacteria bacterium GWF2_38_17]PZM77244.1 MAG: hypothetical protein DKM50_13620 [Candidatus Margulisiibacteriota bacterium]HAR64468.1 hypothetical protein [Candidatus Margulisiibacteriota bacterium]HCY36497.1 hypothetical protein [Candidatus Margulisiibacteriota bacterium]